MLVSDGGDNCAPPAPCGVARDLAKGGVALKIQAVGFQVKSSARKQLQCIAEAGGGRYVDADNAKELGGQLRSLTARALRPYVTQGKALEGVPEPGIGEALRRGPVRHEVPANAPAWYSFKVGAGQSIAISATLPNSDAGIPSMFKTELQDESLEFMDSDAATNGDDVLTAIVQDDVGEDDLRDPPVGRLFYKLEADPTPGQSGPYPVELAVRVTGRCSRRRRPRRIRAGVRRRAAARRRRAERPRAARGRHRRDRGRAGGRRRAGRRAAEAAGVRLLLALVALLAAGGARPPRSPRSPAAARSTTRRCSRPGRYKDTLRGGEQLFYAVELKPGQKLTAGLTVKGRTDSSYFMKLALYSPLREKDVFDGEQTEPYGQTRPQRVAARRGQGGGGGERRHDATASTPSRAPTTSRSAPTTPGRQPRGGPVRLAARPPGDGRDHRRADADRDARGGGDGGPRADGGPRRRRRGDGGSGELGMAIVLGLALGGLVGFGVRRLRAA